MKRVLVAVAAALAAASTGCASARYVNRSGDEGIVSIQTNTDQWPSYNRTAALQLIEQHVGPQYDILEEKEVVTQQQQANAALAPNPSLPVVQGNTKPSASPAPTQPPTEYHIHYRKRFGVPVGTPAGGPGPVGGLPMAPSVMPGAGQPSLGAPAAPVVPAGAASLSPGGMMNGAAPGLPPPNLSGITGVCPTCK